VVLVVVDTLRSDRLSTYGYDLETTPRLDSLAGRGAVFLRHYTEASHTRAAMPSLFYSRHFVKSLDPSSTRVALESASEAFQRLDPRAVALPTALAESGRRTVLISSHLWLDSDSELGRLFDEVHGPRSLAAEPPVDSRAPRVEEVVDRSIEWLDRHGAEPFFLDLHLMDVHQPRAFDADAEAMLRPQASRDEARWTFRDVEMDDPPTAEQIDWLNAVYDGALRRVDRELGRLFDHLEARGLLDETLIVLTSDHGESLGEAGRVVGHGGPLHESVARVPFIVHYPPAVAPQRVEDLTSAVDVMPTILGLTGTVLAPERSMDGLDLSRREAVGKRAAVVTREMVRSGDHKLLVEIQGSALEPSELEPRAVALYDLAADPLERRNLVEERPDRVESLLREYVARLSPAYARFVRSRADRLPAASFALDSRSFEISAPGERAAGWSPEAAGWWIDTSSGVPLLRSSEDARPIEVGVAVPSGFYRVSLTGRGPLDVIARPGACPEGRPERRVAFEGGRTRSIGRLRSCGARLTLELAPHGPVALQLIGFEPLRAGGSPVAAADARRDRDLEALGYIN
jgi:arylsulfatase A-like enzyme